MLSQRWLVNGLLLVAIAILAVIGYRLDGPAEGGPPAPGAATAAVARIEIETAGERLSLQREDGGWMLLEPLRWPADSRSIERLLRIADTGGARPLAAGDVDAASLGLDDPLARLQLGDTRVSFGIVNNIGERRYTMIDSALYLLPDVHLPFILQGSAGFVDRRLLPPRFDLTALSLPGLELRRSGDGGWQAAGRDDIDSSLAAAVAADWQDLEATRIGVYEPTGSPQGRIAAQLGDGEKLEFLLLSTDPELVIASPALGLQYHFRADRYRRLISPSADENPA